jgi:quinolinate synthase
MELTSKELGKEEKRLYQILRKLGWTRVDCKIYAPLTLEINKLKQEKKAIILAHSYQTPDIMYGIADFIGDSYALSCKAAVHPATKIIFCGVYFMAETAKILSPRKKVLVPRRAGCSLAEAITAREVRMLRQKYPQAAVVCYVNTTAEVKAEADVCCTSANVVQIVESLPESEIIFIPDEYMGENLKKLTSKKIITWPGRCIVHENFSSESVKHIRKVYPQAKILAHTECSPAVVALVDFAGGTAGMLNYVRTSKSHQFMVITECGITDRIKAEFPDKKIVGTCSLCPYMKEIRLSEVLQALKTPQKEQVVIVPEEIAIKARRSLEKMISLST